MEEKPSTENTENLAAQLAEAHQRLAQMTQDLQDLKIERSLTCKLAAAGATDLEAALLVAKARLEGQGEAEIDGCIAQLRQEKSYLFGGPTATRSFGLAPTLPARRTAGVRDRQAHHQTALAQAAQKATRSGSRADLLHYLKLRRNLL